MGVVRDSQIFSGHPYRAHRAVIFAIAQLSCYVCMCVFDFDPTSIMIEQRRRAFLARIDTVGFTDVY